MRSKAIVFRAGIFGKAETGCETLGENGNPFIHPFAYLRVNPFDNLHNRRVVAFRRVEHCGVTTAECAAVVDHLEPEWKASTIEFASQLLHERNSGFRAEVPVEPHDIGGVEIGHFNVADGHIETGGDSKQFLWKAQAHAVGGIKRVAIPAVAIDLLYAKRKAVSSSNELSVGPRCDLPSFR